MAQFYNFVRIDGKQVYVNAAAVTQVVEGNPGADGETSVVHFSETHSVRVKLRAAKVALKLSGGK